MASTIAVSFGSSLTAEIVIGLLEAASGLITLALEEKPVHDIVTAGIG